MVTKTYAPAACPDTIGEGEDQCDPGAGAPPEGPMHPGHDGSHPFRPGVPKEHTAYKREKAPRTPRM